jgi:hypothetical protein
VKIEMAQFAILFLVVATPTIHIYGNRKMKITFLK